MRLGLRALTWSARVAAGATMAAARFLCSRGDGAGEDQTGDYEQLHIYILLHHDAGFRANICGCQTVVWRH